MPAAVFAVSASWEPASWDTAELQGVPYILGITHPTGFPLYVMLGYVWSHAIAISTVAWRMNAMSGIAIAVACVAAYGIGPAVRRDPGHRTSGNAVVCFFTQRLGACRAR